MFILYKRMLFLLSGCFILLTILGTITHEYGHIAVAKCLGYQNTLHYASMEWSNNLKSDVLKTYDRYRFEIENNLPFKHKNEYVIKIKKINTDELFITLGGVLLTVFIGTAGFVILLFQYYKAINTTSFMKWGLIFLSLFWSREVFNFFKGIINGIFFNKGNYFWGDELKISNHFGCYEGTFSIISGSIGLCIISFLILKIVPLKYRLTFIFSGVLGSISGYIIWMIILGPMILP